MKLKTRMVNPTLIKDRLCKIQSELSPVNKSFGWFSIVQPVGFMAKIDHPETAKLIHKYRKANSKIAKIYKGRNLVDLVISKLNEE